jgi:nucleoside-diphosphate-sugar epimerase
MRLLFLGGTGLISSACADLAVALGHETWLLNRGRTHNVPVPDGARTVVADAHDPAGVREILSDTTFDAVVQWVGFTPDHVAQDVELFAGCGQYVFISSASAYQKPPRHFLIRERSTPLANPYWQYSRDKIAAEAVLREAHATSGFPVTIVRPSLTYGPSQIPVCLASWEKPFTIIDRIRRGAKIIIPGDGTSLWTLTHNSDFATGLLGLLGNPRTIGEAIHITSDEVLTWNQIYADVASAAGAEADVLHVPTDALIAADPELEGPLWGDKVHSTVFDNSHLRDLVPSFEAKLPFAVGIRESVAWFDDDPARQQIDHGANELWDRVARVYGEALAQVAIRP